MVGPDGSVGGKIVLTLLAEVVAFYVRLTAVDVRGLGCKEHLNRGNEMIDIKGTLGLAKRAINRKVIAMTNCYQTAVGKVSYFNYNRYQDTLPVSWYLTNSLDTR